MAEITYITGPAGIAVVKDGKPWGAIRDVRQHGGWIVSVPGLNAAVTPGKVVFKRLRAAKSAIEQHAKGNSHV